MTNLTEKWKKGKLEEYKRYYCKTVWFEDIFMARCHNKGQNDEWWTLENEKYSYNNVNHIKDIEVLAEVPSFEQWQEYKDANDSMFDTIKMLNKDNYKLEKENTQLKKLLKLNNILNKGSKAIYAWLKEDTAGEQKKLCADMFDKTVEMMSEINQVLGEE